ncbi:MAG: DUF1826 domain-containing protein [Limnobacter sp.]|nr:DUF1826 domain-containing protein [Limnobacter sp.]
MEKIDGFFKKILAAILPCAAPALKYTEFFEVKRPRLGNADSWHVDKDPKLLTCLATISGKPTEYVPETVKQNKFEENLHQYTLKKGVDLSADIQTLPAGHLHIFLCRGLHRYAPDTKQPLLLHRAPPAAPGTRTILLIRFNLKNYPPEAVVVKQSVVYFKKSRL